MTPTPPSLPKWIAEIETCPDDCSDVYDLKEAMTIAWAALDQINREEPMFAEEIARKAQRDIRRLGR